MEHMVFSAEAIASIIQQLRERSDVTIEEIRDTDQAVIILGRLSGKTGYISGTIAYLPKAEKVTR